MTMIKDFERIQTTIRATRELWEKGKIKPGKTNSYIDIWRKMNHYKDFMTNERKDYDREFGRLSDLYNPTVIAQEKNHFNDEYGKLSAVVTAAFRNTINSFTEENHKRVSTMVCTAPSASMRDLLETLKMRDDLSESELYDIMPMFYENYHAMRALQSIARQNGISLITPVQMDSVAMHEIIDKAADYLRGACAELLTPKSDKTRYNDFFTTNPEEKDTIYAPAYQELVSVLDTVPQLQDFTATKTSLSPLEKAKIDWYYRDTPKDTNLTQLAQRTKEIMEKHPEDIGLLKLSKYAECVETVESAGTEE